MQQLILKKPYQRRKINKYHKKLSPMKYTPIYILFLLFFQYSIAQQVHWVNPKPSGGIFHDIEFFDDDHALMCGDGGQIYQSRDGGAEWELVFNNGKEPISQINILNSSKALLLLGDAEIIGTDTRGQVWFKTYRLTDSLKIKRFKMLTENEGHLLVQHRENEKFYFGLSRDAGQTWDFKSVEQMMGEDLYVRDFAFTEFGKGIFLTHLNYRHRIYRTSDSCKTFEHNEYDDCWGFYSASNTPSGIYIAGFFKLCKKDSGNSEDQNNYYYYEGVIWKTTDNGSNLDITFKDAYRPLKIKSVGDSCLYAYGDCDFHIEEGCAVLPLLSSEDAGQNWTLNETPYGFFSKGINRPIIKAFGTNKAGRALLCMSSILENSYTGQTFSVLLASDNSTMWKKLPGNYIEQFNSLVFLKKGMFLGSEKTILSGASLDTVYTSNAYTNIYTQYDESIAIAFTYKADNSIILLSTHDGGSSWHETETGMDIYPNSISMPSTNELYIYQYHKDFGVPAKFIKYNIGTQESQEIPIPDERDAMKSMIYTQDVGYLFGGYENEGGYFRTFDEGQNWEFVNLNLSHPIHHALQINDSIFIAELSNGYYKSGNSETEIWSVNIKTGKLMENLYTGNGMGMHLDMLMDGSGQLWVLCDEGIFILRYNNVWEKLDELPDLLGLTLDPDGKHVWAYGYAGRLLYIGDGLPVGTEDRIKKEQSVLSINGNPFKDNLEVRNYSTAPTKAQLTLTDLSGRKIVRKGIYLHSPTSKFVINTSQLCSGTYICTLIIDGKAYSEKVTKF